MSQLVDFTWGYDSCGQKDRDRDRRRDRGQMERKSGGVTRRERTRREGLLLPKSCCPQCLATVSLIQSHLYQVWRSLRTLIMQNYSKRRVYFEGAATQDFPRTLSETRALTVNRQMEVNISVTSP